MRANLDPRNFTENNISFGGEKIRSLTRVYCDLCGEVVALRIEHYDGRVEKQDLSEYHTGYSE